MLVSRGVVLKDVVATMEEMGKAKLGRSSDNLAAPWVTGLSICQQAALATWKQPAVVIHAGHMSAANWLITSEPRPEWVKNSRKVVGYREDMAIAYVRWISMLPVEEQLELVPHPQARVARFPEQGRIAASKLPTKHQRRELTRSGRRTDRLAPNEVAFWRDWWDLLFQEDPGGLFFLIWADTLTETMKECD